MVFLVVTHKYGVLVHHIEIGPFTSNFGLPSSPSPSLKDNEEIRIPREVVDTFNNWIVNLTVLSSRPRVMVTFYSSLTNIPIPLTSVLPPLSRGL